MTRTLLGWSIGFAALLTACGGDTFTSSENGDASVGTGGSLGTGGTSGTGGSNATGGFKATGGSAGGGGGACDPLPGCTPTSATTCSDGCNTCSCSGGQWGCTARACPPPADATADAPTFLCGTDTDCIYRSQAGCCGMCLAVSDPVPAPIACGRMCFAYNGCACVDGKCATGTLAPGTPCKLDHDLCGAGTRCCSRCGGPLPPDGATCPPPACTMPLSTGSCPLLD